MRFDIAAGIGLFLASVMSLGLMTVINPLVVPAGRLGWALLFSALMTLPLIWRRRFPIMVAVIVCIAYFVSMTVQAPEWFVSQIVLFAAIYTIGAVSTDRRRANLARVLLIAGMGLWLLVNTFMLADEAGDQAALMSPHVATVLLTWLMNAAYFGGAFALGDLAWKASRQRELLLERTHELEAEREVTAAQAVALDRVRIARELHDVVAHHVSAMGIQAGAARVMMDRDPEAARQALGVIEESTRSAITELHHLLDTLRTSPDSDDSEAPSTLSLDRLDHLAQTMTASGTPTTCTVIGEPFPVTDLVQVNLHRIAQEALTNVRRHAGPDATAEIRLRYGDGFVELEVTNTGRIVLNTQPGLGHLGMRERMTASGGMLEARALRDGGYLVRATVPVDSVVPA